MRVPFYDLGRLYRAHQAEVDRAVAECLESGWYVLGPASARFEEAMGRTLGRAVVGCNSGTDALSLSLLAAGVGPGDEVVTVGLTAVPTATAIAAVGARPVFVDVDPRTWVMDVGAAEAALTPRTRAVVPVHLYGNVADVPELLRRLARAGRDDVAVVEDVAQAHGATLGGVPAGALGRFGAFSFYPTKNIGALGDAGAVACDDGPDRERLRMLRHYGQRDRYRAALPRGLNSRLDDLQAAVLETRLPRLDDWNRVRARQVALYRDALSNLRLDFQEPTPGCAPAWHLCVVALPSRAARDALLASLEARGVQAIVHYPLPCHLQDPFRADPPPSLPVSESLADRVLSLPMNVVLTDDEQAHVVASVRASLGA